MKSRQILLKIKDTKVNRGVKRNIYQLLIRVKVSRHPSDSTVNVKLLYPVIARMTSVKRKFSNVKDEIGGRYLKKSSAVT